MSELATLSKNTFHDLAQLAGMSTLSRDTKASSLTRLAIQAKPISAKQEIKGKQVNVEVVEAGSFRIEETTTGGKTFYATDVTLRPFMQRVYYRRWVNAKGEASGYYLKTVMANDLLSELKDSDGGFNCGKPSQYFEDWSTVPQNVKELITTTKRIRVVFGTIEVKGAIDEEGNPVETPDAIPVVWEVTSKEGYNTLNAPFARIFKMQALPMEYSIALSTGPRELPNGEYFYVPSVSLDLKNKIPLTDKDEEMFTSFVEWVTNTNSYILSKWDDNNVEDVDEDTKALVDEFIDVDSEEAA